MEDGPKKDRVREAHKEMTQAATHPLGHALRLLGSRFNDLGHRRRSNLAGSMSDRVLAQHIKQPPLGFDSLLESSLQPAIDASATRRQQDLIAAALRSNGRLPRRDKSRSPVRRNTPSQSQTARPSYQPFRQGSCGSSRGSRGNQRGSRGHRGGRSFSRRSRLPRTAGGESPMVGHKRTGLLCPRSGTGTQAEILCSTASVVAKKTLQYRRSGARKGDSSKRKWTFCLSRELFLV